MIARKILWLENEPQFHETFADYFRTRGYHVRFATRVTEAESLLGSGEFDLLILDVMIPLWDAAEEERYPPRLTDRGRLTGLHFYRLMQKNPNLRACPVLVYTIMSDVPLVVAFRDEGLPDGCFANKFEYQDPEDLLRKVEEIVGPV
jgi:CheY-like chemotaxis protein